MFSSGEATLPKDGIQKIPRLMSQQIPDQMIHLNTQVESISEGTVFCEDGRTFDAEVIILANPNINLLENFDGEKNRDWNSTSCFYFEIDDPPISEPILVINSEEQKSINNLCFPSLVCPSYSPENKHLLSVSTVGMCDTGNSLSSVKNELRDMFGPRTDEWDHLKTYHIPKALPAYESDKKDLKNFTDELDWLYLCGDYREDPSINGAMRSGRLTAQEIRKQFDLR
jgi:protoporphyrinogen oxidase